MNLLRWVYGLFALTIETKLILLARKRLNSTIGSGNVRNKEGGSDSNPKLSRRSISVGSCKIACSVPFCRKSPPLIYLLWCTLKRAARGFLVIFNFSLPSLSLVFRMLASQPNLVTNKSETTQCLTRLEFIASLASLSRSVIACSCAFVPDANYSAFGTSSRLTSAALILDFTSAAALDSALFVGVLTAWRISI